MTYQELSNKINTDTTGLAKGYEICFLQNTYFGLNSSEGFDNLIKNDLKLFQAIEESFKEVKKPMMGDFVQCEDGSYGKISCIHQDGKIQLSNNIGVYVSDKFAQASGCTWDSDFDYIDRDKLCLNNLVLLDEQKKGHCWTFSGNNSGRNRGVYFDINFKVWKLAI